MTTTELIDTIVESISSELQAGAESKTEHDDSTCPACSSKNEFITSGGVQSIIAIVMMFRITGQTEPVASYMDAACLGYLIGRRVEAAKELERLAETVK